MKQQPKNDEEDNDSTTTTTSEDNIISCLIEWILSVWEFAIEDVNRILFSLKVGLAVLLVSLLILIRASYQLFGTDIIWSILTVAVMFEYTVGATFNRGFNRAVGSLFAGVLAVVIAQLALTTGRIAEPIIIAISIFVVGTITSFMKLWPSLVPYEYGFRVVLFTYCLVIVSGYRMGNPLKAAFDRLYSIAIGALVVVFVNLLVFPVWAGEQLHNELVANFNSLADLLEECVEKYLEEEESDVSEFTKNIMDSFEDEPAYMNCRSTLNSSRLESLANSAKWEPPHGKFKGFFYPWNEYVKVGAVLKYCAYEVMAIHGVLHSEIKAPHFVRIMFEKEIEEAGKQAAEVVRFLGEDISKMQISSKTALLHQLHISTQRLEHAISSTHLLQQQNLTDLEYYIIPNRRRRRRIEGTAALSLATFTSLLIEFVARLDHLIQAVDDLSIIAKFKHID